MWRVVYIISRIGAGARKARAITYSGELRPPETPKGEGLAGAGRSLSPMLSRNHTFGAVIGYTTSPKSKSNITSKRSKTSVAKIDIDLAKLTNTFKKDPTAEKNDFNISKILPPPNEAVIFFTLKAKEDNPSINTEKSSFISGIAFRKVVRLY